MNVKEITRPSEDAHTDTDMVLGAEGPNDAELYAERMRNDLYFTFGQPEASEEDGEAQAQDGAAAEGARRPEC